MSPRLMFLQLLSLPRQLADAWKAACVQPRALMIPVERDRRRR
ncbi:hypothetical protein [Wenxinia marina]|uniref:Uncharacterized protein n=1 Tax=Wenxinia marina DSM 24838 TaxID=1123501 RepID=A0A0D0P8U4_9RHOB|nr:hypothetical protein [Wenxinia marina]KIQ67996.1 hypothetical protein Wenmar_03451 [Wenxinia marina DSM 24838]